MGLTVVNKNPNKSAVSAGALRVSTIEVDYDSSYATGGEALVAADFGLQRLDLVLASPKQGFMFEYDYTNAKLKAFFPTGGAGTPAAALAVPAGLAATGASTASAVDATRPTVAILPGVGAEVASTQNLSTLVGVRVLAIGI